MNREQKNRRRIGTPPAEGLGNAAAGALLGAVVAGPVGAVAGAAVGAMVEKGIPQRKKRVKNRKASGDKSRPVRKGNRRVTASDA